MHVRFAQQIQGLQAADGVAARLRRKAPVQRERVVVVIVLDRDRVGALGGDLAKAEELLLVAIEIEARHDERKERDRGDRSRGERRDHNPPASRAQRGDADDHAVGQTAEDQEVDAAEIRDHEEERERHDPDTTVATRHCATRRS